jgi:hypothetical protein
MTFPHSSLNTKTTYKYLKYAQVSVVGTGLFSCTRIKNLLTCTAKRPPSQEGEVFVSKRFARIENKKQEQIAISKTKSEATLHCMFILVTMNQSSKSGGSTISPNHFASAVVWWAMAGGVADQTALVATSKPLLGTCTYVNKPAATSVLWYYLPAEPCLTSAACCIVTL